MIDHKNLIQKIKDGDVPIYCLQCGVELPEGSTFCNKCGAKQESISEKPSEPETTLFSHKGYMCEGIIHGLLSQGQMKKGDLLLTNHKLSFDGFDIPLSEIKRVEQIERRGNPFLAVYTKDNRLYHYAVFSIHRYKTKEFISLLERVVTP